MSLRNLTTVYELELQSRAVQARVSFEKRSMDGVENLKIVEKFNRSLRL